MERILYSPSAYIQGAGQWKKLALYYGSMGKSGIYLLEDPFVNQNYGSLVRKSFEDAEIPFKEEVYSGACSERDIRNQVKHLGECDVIAGIGGGKVQDAAKALGFYAGKPVMIVPSTCSTDAPCSRISVLYHEDGTFDRYLSLKSSPRMVVMDTDIIAHGPVRLFAAGMGDALSTYYEASACDRAGGLTKAGGRPGKAALALAEACLDTILEFGIQAKSDVAEGRCSEAVEAVVEANTYLSGIGFESGGLAGAHALHNGLALLKECGHIMHGEKVAFCTLVQLVLEGRPTAELLSVREFVKQAGLPSCLEDMGLGDCSDELLLKAAAAACSPSETMRYVKPGISARDVVEAMKSL